LRALKALVAGLGVLILLGTALVAGVIIHRIYARVSPPASMPAGPAVPGPGVAPVKLAPGEHVAGIAAAGGALGVWVSGPQGDRVLLIDPASGQARQVLGP